MMSTTDLFVAVDPQPGPQGMAMTSNDGSFYYDAVEVGGGYDARFWKAPPNCVGVEQRDGLWVWVVALPAGGEGQVQP